MTILKVKAFADFDAPYEINIGVGDNGRVRNICEILNNFCKQLPSLDQDIKLSIYLDEIEYSNILIHRLIDSGHFTTRRAMNFVEELKEVCEHNWVYVNDNIFTVEDVEQI